MSQLAGESPRGLVRVVGQCNAARDDPAAAARDDEFRIEAEQARVEMQGDVTGASL